MGNAPNNDALIGHTGFVGGTLARDRAFAGLFNSRNIDTIRGRQFDTVVCAGVSAVKWLANKEPEQDWRAISGLIANLSAVEAKRFVLISTVDVYRDPIGVTENDVPPTDNLHAYGLHRLRLEAFVRSQFANHAIVRLPALFGAGLRKNALYDMLHLNQTEKIAPNGVFQWYPTARLADDLDRIRDAGVGLINVTAEPVDLAAIHDRFFSEVPIGPAMERPPIYDVRSIHDTVLGGSGGYHLSRDAVFDALAAFVAAERGQP